jgi:hypothetical protein
VPPTSTRQRPADLEVLAFLQDAVISRRQLAECGYDNDAVGRRLSSHRWQPLGRAIVLHGGQLGERDHQWAAALSGSPITAVAGASAARRYGLRGYESTLVHVLIPAGSRPVAIPRVQWHESRRFTAADIAPGSAPPVVRVGRAIVDTAAWTQSPRGACAAMVASVQQRLVSAGALRAELALAGQIRHGALLRGVLADIEGGADSLSEIDIGKLARRAGLPPPIRQAFRVDSDGRRRFLDADFEAFAVEVDGGFHIQVRAAWADAHRQNALVIGGDRILRFPSVAIRVDPDSVVAQLRAAGVKFGVIDRSARRHTR